MEKISTTTIKDLVIEGVDGDYVFETIKKQSTFYENSILEKWLPYISGSKLILDIGANLGNHTLFWAKNIEYSAIYSFEPYSVNYERLAHNIANNSLKNIYPVNHGVGACKGYTSILSFSEDNYGATTLDANISDTGEISIIDIDSFVSEHELNRVDFVKIDTEGFEESVLSGMQRVIELYRPDLWIEVSEESFHPIIDVLSAKGYVIRDVDGFNMLFLSPKRHINLPQADMADILKQHFNNLSRTNKYYQNYITAKGWVDSKNAVIENLNHRYDAQGKELLDAKQKIQEQKENLLLLQKEIHALDQQLQESKEQEYEFSQELVDLIRTQDSQVQILLHTKHVIQTQQRELQRLREENELNKQRWERLSNKWYGRLALKVYYRLRVLNILK